MFKKQKSEVLDLDGYGTCLWRSKRLNKADSIYATTWVANIATALFTIADFLCLYNVFNTVQTESSIMILIITISAAICLDVPLAIGGHALKSYHQKLRDKHSTMIVLVLAIITFSITFMFALWFRLETRDLTFDISSSATLTNTLATNTNQENRENGAVIVAGWFNGILPFCSSIASFVITYFASNPLGLKIARYDEAIITLDANLIEIEQVLKEVELTQLYKDFLLAWDGDMCEQFCESSEAQGLVRKQNVRFAIMKMLGSPDDITVLTESGMQINKESEAKFDHDSKSALILSTQV